MLSDLLRFSSSLNARCPSQLARNLVDLWSRVRLSRVSIIYLGVHAQPCQRTRRLSRNSGSQLSRYRRLYRADSRVESTMPALGQAVSSKYKATSNRLQVRFRVELQWCWASFHAVSRIHCRFNSFTRLNLGLSLIIQVMVSTPSSDEDRFARAMRGYQNEHSAISSTLQEIEQARASGGDPQKILAQQAQRWEDEDVQLSNQLKGKVKIPLYGTFAHCYCLLTRDEQGNKAFNAGDMRQAYILYTACLQRMYGGPDAVHWLNRAAVCLKVKAYVVRHCNRYVCSTSCYHFLGDSWAFLASQF